MALPTYENDRDFNALIYSDITTDRLLDFFFKKGGLVNINNAHYLIVKSNRTTNFIKALKSLEADGFVKPFDSHCCKVTIKARWVRIRDNKMWNLIAAIASIGAFLILIGQVLKWIK